MSTNDKILVIMGAILLIYIVFVQYIHYREKRKERYMVKIRMLSILAEDAMKKGDSNTVHEYVNKIGEEMHQGKISAEELIQQSIQEAQVDKKKSKGELN